MNDTHSNLEWTWGDERISFTIPDSEPTLYCQLLKAMTNESRRRNRNKTILDYTWWFMVLAMIIAWWTVVFCTGNTYCK